jgi:hypothetical protein
VLDRDEHDRLHAFAAGVVTTLAQKRQSALEDVAVAV